MKATVRQRLMTFAILAGGVLAAPIHAGTIGVDPNGGNANFAIGPNPSSFGFAFTVNSPITIDSLLLFDTAANGINGGTVTVSIFPDDGSMTPVSGITAAFDGSTSTYFADDVPVGGAWLELDIADTLLAPSDYTAIAQGVITSSLGDTVIGGATAVTPAEITYNGPRAAFDVLNNPTGDATGGAADDAFYGPNFTFLIEGTADVPEPATASLCVLGLAALAIRRR